MRLLHNGRYQGEMAENRRKSSLDQQIDENLRRVYSEASQEPVPERFTKLLDQLRQRESSQRDEASEEDR